MSQKWIVIDVNISTFYLKYTENLHKMFFFANIFLIKNDMKTNKYSNIFHK